MADFNEVNTDTLISYTTQNLGMGSILIVTTDPALSSVTEWDKSSSLSRFRVLDNVTFYGLYTSMHCRKLIHFNDDFNGFGAYSAKLWIKIWMTQMLVSTMIGKTLFRWQALSDFWNVTVKAWITWMLLLYIVSLWKSRQ